MKRKLAIGAALLLCLAFVAVAPAVAAGSQDGQTGQQACWQNSTQEDTAAGTCVCAATGDCQQDRSVTQTKSMTSSGAGTCVCAAAGDCQQDRSVTQTKAMTSSGDGTCDSTCDQTRDRTFERICQTE